VYFGAANAAISVFLPWMRFATGSVSGLALARSPELARALLFACGGGWVATAVWSVPLAGALSAACAFADRRRPLGPAPGAIAVISGLWLIALASAVFATVEPLRQIGVLACGVAGLVLAGGGSLMLAGKWERSPPRKGGVANLHGHVPWASAALVAANLAAHVAVTMLPATDRLEAARTFGLMPASMKWYALFTHQFLHGGVLHLAANLAVLVAVGAALERRIGRPAFLLVYFASGVAGGLVSAALDPRIHVPLVGASGAVAGAVGACLAVAPGSRVTVWFHAGVTAGRARVRAAWLFSAWILYQAVGSFYLALEEPDPVAYWAHLGGVALGLGSGAALRLAGLVRETDGAEAGHPAPAILRRARAREAAAARYVPLGFVAAALLVSLVAVAVSFGRGSFTRVLARFQGAWNSGELDRLEALFPEEGRGELSARLRRLVRKFDETAAEGRTSWRIALAGATGGKRERAAVFRLAPPGGDPYRETTGSVLRAFLRRERGAWVVVALSFVGGADCARYLRRS
jgi:membrane associated rhomboid family serine protease